MTSRQQTSSLRHHAQAMRAVCKMVVRAGYDMTLGKYDDVVWSMDRAIKSDEGCSTAWLVRGRAKYCKGQIEGAIEDFTRAIEGDELGEDKERLRIILGDLYQKGLMTFDLFKVHVMGTMVESFKDGTLEGSEEMTKVSGKTT